MDHSLPSTFQFERTREIRAAVFREGRLAARRRVLDVGAGACLVAAEMAARTGRAVAALDVVPPPARVQGVHFIQGEAEALPLASGVLDAVCFHFVLLWLRDPLQALREARRVLAPAGVVMILSEPDLASRRDEPDTGLGRAIAQSVERMDGHPAAGREAARWLEEAGFRPLLKTTRLEWRALSEPAEAEWELAFLAERGILGRARASAMAQEEREASRLGVRRVLLPLTYGLGLKRE
jgi:ubiquinone/menaquinone biosynthesis C-methylase UbiE